MFSGVLLRMFTFTYGRPPSPKDCQFPSGFPQEVSNGCSLEIPHGFSPLRVLGVQYVAPIGGNQSTVIDVYSCRMKPFLPARRKDIAYLAACRKGS